MAEDLKSSFLLSRVTAVPAAEERHLLPCVVSKLDLKDSVSKG